MNNTIRIIGVGLCIFICQVARSDTWYVNGSVSESGNGQSWETAFKTIQEGIDAASSTDTVIVAEGTYVENIRWPGPIIFEENFDTYTTLYTHDDVVTAGWEVVNGSGDPNAPWRLWSTTGQFLREENPAIVGMTNNYMITDSDLASDADMNEELITPPIDCRDWTQVRLSFNKNIRVYDNDPTHTQITEVDIRVFDPAAGWGAWETLLHYDRTMVDRYDTSPEDLDISAYADRKKIQVRWHFYEAKYDWWFAIDDIAVSGQPDVKNITLKSTDPLDSATVAGTVIDGSGRGAVVTFSGAESEKCVLTGFTIRNGAGDRGGGICGGTRLSQTHAIIQNNVITGNSAEYGGGLTYCNGMIRNNIISANSATSNGGGLSDCDGTIQNNTVVMNSSDYQGGGLNFCQGTIRNCIIWGNLDSFNGPQLSASSAPTYSCIEKWEQGGEGNISSPPYFVNPQGGDYHLWSWSFCIDAGDPVSDFSLEAPPNGGRVNMGAYGNTPEATSASEDTDEDSLPDDWERYFFGDLTQGPSDDPDGDGDSNLDEYLHATHPASLVGWCVDGAAATSGNGTSWQTAFKSIQEGIDAASDGDIIFVAPSVYYENIRFKGKNIRLTSTDPLDASVVENTVIDGNQAGSVVTFDGTEDETCVLEGFTIQDGFADYPQGGYGGGIFGAMLDFENLTRATIQNNVITHNDAYRGGGIALCSGAIRNNTISENSAGRGGGLRLCDGIIQNNLIAGNSSRGGAAGLSGCDGPILNNTVVGNSTTGDESLSGGLGGCSGIIRNCIIWGNTLEGEGAQLSNCSEPAYCCIQDWTGGGVDNTDRDPLFTDAPGGDYRLQSESPCIDTGVNYYWCAWPQRDLDGNCRLGGEQVDMGCYEYSSTPDSDGDLLSDADEPASGTDLANDDADGDGLRDGLELLRGTNPLTPDEPATIHIPSEILSLQAALCLALNGDEIILAPGTYPGNLQFCGTDVVLRSSNPDNPEIVASTVLDGAGAERVISFTGYETEHCVLSGFTICNGKAPIGGGIYGGNEQNLTHATIQKNTITNNSGDFCGGGVVFCGGAIQNNLIRGNSANDGGGLFACPGTIQNNIISGNSARLTGGGLSQCHGVIQNNTITGNSAGRDGGGLYSCWGTTVNCIIWGNTAPNAPQLYNSTQPTYSCIQDWTPPGRGEGNIAQDPEFADPENGNSHLLPSSPCIDSGNNSAASPDDTDLAGMHRILYGGKSLTVDMGAYEYYINELGAGPGADETTLIWSSLADRTYSIFYTDDLLTWHLADDDVRSAGDITTSWTDDGSKTGIAPLLAPRRFYRILENP